MAWETRTVTSRRCHAAGRTRETRLAILSAGGFSILINAHHKLLLVLEVAGFAMEGDEEFFDSEVLHEEDIVEVLDLSDRPPEDGS